MIHIRVQDVPLRKTTIRFSIKNGGKEEKGKGVKVKRSYYVESSFSLEKGEFEAETISRVPRLVVLACFHSGTVGKKAIDFITR